MAVMNFPPTGPGWNLIITKTASGAASIDFTSLITAEFDQYVFVFDGLINATNTHYLLMLLSSDNGSTWVTSNYYRGNFYGSNTGGVLNDNGGPTADAKLSLLQDNSYTNGLYGQLWLPNPLLNGNRVTYYGWTISSTSTILCFYNIGGVQVSTAAWNAVQFKYDTGNITGKIHLFGLRKTP